MRACILENLKPNVAVSRTHRSDGINDDKNCVVSLEQIKAGLLDADMRLTTIQDCLVSAIVEHQMLQMSLYTFIDHGEFTLIVEHSDSRVVFGTDSLVNWSRFDVSRGHNRYGEQLGCLGQSHPILSHGRVINHVA